MEEGHKPTSTSEFGVGRRESHDASSFYARFTPPEISNDASVAERANVSRVICGDARVMDASKPVIPDNSVALVVTSPPYFVGKEYETAMGEGHVPSSYADYLRMLHDVFAECVRKLEPGGRIAVNVANLGRKPYRSLSADVIRVLQDDLHLLLRGEIIWQKGKGATGSCAWGSFQSASNPVLRDLTERVVIASKGRFNRAIDKPQRERFGFPSEDTIYKDDFMDWTMDVWDIPPESANRVGHPAPFPVELPQRLIELYTYRGDFVLDPFIGSGSTAVAAVRTDRNYLGFDTDQEYVDTARERAAEAQRERELRTGDSSGESPDGSATGRLWRFVPREARETDGDDDFQRRASREGRMAKELALDLLTEAGFVDITDKAKPAPGLQMNFAARDRGRKHHWYFDVSGAFTKGNARAGLRRTDTLWKALGRAAVAQNSLEECRVVLLTTDLPTPRSAGGSALRGARGSGGIIFDAIEMLSPEGRDRLSRYAAGAGDDGPLGELYPPRSAGRS